MTTRAKPKPVVATRWEIAIPGCHPPRLNQLMHCHWAVKNKRKKAWTLALGTFAQGVPTATTKRRVTLVITLAPKQRSPDVDAFWKSVLDSCVALGLLVDDNPKWVEISPVVYLRGEDKATTLVLEDID